MQNKDQLDTRAKIIKAAAELFGRFGFDGTSVRTISKQCGVNLAAINYHFTHKDNLFWEVMTRTYSDLEAKIGEFAQTSESTVELAMKTFDYFQSEKLALKGAMKMMLDEGIRPPECEEIRKALEKPMGPPGGIYFTQAIQRDVGYPLNREGQLWGVKSVFGSVFHWGIMLCAGHCERETDPLMSPQQIRKDVERMVNAAMAYLKANKEEFLDKNA